MDNSILPYPVRGYSFLLQQKRRIYAAFGVSQTPKMILKKGGEISEADKKDIDKYIKNGFPISVGQDGCYLWEGKPIVGEKLKKIVVGGKESYCFSEKR